MSGRVKRPYRSPLRADAARRTRAAIRTAAARLFVADGYVSTTMQGIADEAGVALRTVFTAFPGGKAEVFGEALDVAVAGDEEPIAMADRPGFHAALADPDGLVGALVDQGADLLDRAGPLIMASVESAGADPDMRRIADEGAAAMARNMTTVAEALARHGLLRADLTVERAADILMTLNSPHVHAILCGYQGWSWSDYREWLHATITTTVLAPDRAHQDVLDPSAGPERGNGTNGVEPSR